MPLGTEVLVEKETIEFPEQCVVCGRHAGGDHVPMRANPHGINGMVPWLFGRAKVLEFSAHRDCGSRLRRVVLARNLLILFMVTGIIVVGFVYEWNTWLILAAVIVGALVPTIWQTLRPVPFEFVHMGNNTYKLMFRNRDYAREVADLNDGILEDDDREEEEDDVDRLRREMRESVNEGPPERS